ncbi:diacylglyceryl transferase [Myroides sp. NP-2]|uniref:DUF6787 family protein n=1 Tax=Myroides sp. NP-2 TaxID=2759945 RepID=UPI0015FDDB5E|nr:DUF6787 family protein [Myroides sp. NP-2]MBB1149462.1 diacylglyceryl transferase [Myroides sp. NP-2]
MEKLKQRWGLTSNFQVGIILVVFAITGSTAAFISKPILTYLGIERGLTHPLLYWVLYVLIIFPMYKVILICIGTLFGQREFFWNFVKKMLTRMGLGFIYPKEKVEK